MKKLTTSNSKFITKPLFVELLLSIALQLLTWSFDDNIYLYTGIRSRFFHVVGWKWFHVLFVFCRDLRPQSTEKRQERIRLRLYEAYAWGVPLLIASIAAILDILPQNPDYDFLRPKFGERMCWFYGKYIEII